MRLRVETQVRPTEDRSKVEAAVRKIFPILELSLSGDLLVGESTQTEALARLHGLLRQQAILDSARAVMRAGREGNTVRFALNKQAAFAGKVSFTDGESPLGPIVVRLEAPNPERLIDYLAPPTRAGRPIEEITYE